MELFFRKYFWAVNLCFLALVALLAATHGEPVRRGRHRPRRPRRRPAGARPAPAPGGGRRPRSTWRQLSRSSPDLPSPPVAARPRPEPPVAGHERRAGAHLPRVKLLGHPGGALTQTGPFASIQDMVTRSPRRTWWATRSRAPRCSRSSATRVIILNNGRREFIDGQRGDGAPRRRPSPPPRPVSDAGRRPPAPRGGHPRRSARTNTRSPARRSTRRWPTSTTWRCRRASFPPSRTASAAGLQALLHPPRLHLLEDRRAERRRHQAHQRLRPEQPGEGARGLLQAQRSLPHRHRDRAQRLNRSARRTTSADHHACTSVPAS